MSVDKEHGKLGLRVILTALATLGGLGGLGGLLSGLSDFGKQYFGDHTGLPLSIIGFVIATLAILTRIAVIRWADDQMKVTQLEGELSDNKKAMHLCWEIGRDIKRTHNTLWGRTNAKVKQMKRVERAAIKGVCEKLARLFHLITGKECKVSVKLIISENSERYAQVFVRNIEPCLRDDNEITARLGDGSNTGLDDALARTASSIRYFFSNDLSKAQKYSNCRSEWKSYYLSTIVVPISSDGKEKNDDIGFLCLDCKEVEVFDELRDTRLLAIFADKLYVFMASVRACGRSERRNTEQEQPSLTP